MSSEEERLMRDFCDVIGGERLRQLHDGRWTFLVRHTVTAEDVRRSGLAKKSAFVDLFDFETKP